jgi:hypothetical protein
MGIELRLTSAHQYTELLFHSPQRCGWRLNCDACVASTLQNTSASLQYHQASALVRICSSHTRTDPPDLERLVA